MPLGLCPPDAELLLWWLPQLHPADQLQRVEAEELRESTRKELSQIRQNTFDYLDNVMGEVDRCLSGLVSDIRLERGELNNHR